MSNYSKAPRGLFVLVELGRIFTAIAISPSESSRQLLARDAIRAGRNLPDKELRLECYLYVSIELGPYLFRLNRNSTYGL